MDIAFRKIPETEMEYLILVAMYKTNKEAIWPILHRWLKTYGLPKEGYYLQFLLYIRKN